MQINYLDFNRNPWGTLGALVGAITGWIEGIFLNGFACLVKNTKETRDFVASIDQKLGNKD